MQLIAASSMQQQIETNLRKAVEASALLLEQEMELPFAPGLASQASKADGTKRRGSVCHEPVGLKH
jgi:hypothetical protein